MQSIPMSIFGLCLFLTALLPWPEGLNMHVLPYERFLVFVAGVVMQILAVWCGVTERKDWERWMKKRK